MTPVKIEKANDETERRRPEAATSTDVARVGGVGLSVNSSGSRGLLLEGAVTREPENFPDERWLAGLEEEEEEEGGGGGGGGGATGRILVPPRVLDAQSQPLKTSARTHLGVRLRRLRKS